MKKYLLILLHPFTAVCMQIFIAVIFTSMIFPFQQEPEKCGINRWGEKTLMDSLSSKVKMKPIKTTIDSLRSIKPDRKIGNKTPRFGAEFYTFQIICGISEYSNEEDGDIHLILFDLKDTTKTFIAEIPDPNCPSVKGSKYAGKYQKCRDEFNKYKLPKKKVLKGEYKISGAFFYDKPHGAKGASPNSAELHPVLTIKKVK